MTTTAEPRARLRERLADHVESELARVPDDQAGDVYAVGLLLAFTDPHPSPPRLQLAWNTERHFAPADEVAGVRLRLDTRWNFGMWVQDGRRIHDDLQKRALVPRRWRTADSVTRSPTRSQTQASNVTWPSVSPRPG